ncbi:early nodulin-like protein 6 [Malus domestica]|uniref:early nodulin-like protein 6 n=1 Tax=Malus domestica TaxID=3750 RepID=UPI0039750C77
MEWKGNDLKSKCEFVRRMDCGREVDFHKVFDLFLQVAVNENLRPDQMIKKFEVEDKSNGWEVPKSKTDQDMYNKWASKKRFKVDDTIYFSYKKNTDSVLVVTKEDYKNCNSDQPIYFSNDGYSVVILDRPGLFYFISGVAGRCEKGQKMIIKVMEPVAVGAPNQSPKDHSATDSPPQQNASKNHKANVSAADIHLSQTLRKAGALCTGYDLINLQILLKSDTKIVW